MPILPPGFTELTSASELSFTPDSMVAISPTAASAFAGMALISAFALGEFGTLCG